MPTAPWWRRPAAQAALAVVVLLAVHSRVYTIPFLYTEVTGLQHAPVVTDPATFRRRMLTPGALLARPLSVASFALDHRLHGDAVAGWHATNVAIHAVNTVLVLLIAQRFFAAPLLAALVFALHPLATGAVSLLFGRSYALGATFALLALLLHLGWRRAAPLRPMQVSVLAGLCLLAFLAKQTYVAFPLVLLWVEVGRHGTRLSARLLGLVGAAALAIGVATALYAVPLSRTAAIPPATWIRSQLAHVPTLAGFFLLPGGPALVHDLPVYRTWLHLDVALGAAALAVAVAAAWRWRRHPCGWLLGALLLALVPTNGVLPKNDLVRDWRLYPAIAFFALLAAEVVARVTARLRVRHERLGGLAWAVVVLWLVAFARADVHQDRVYQSELGAWRQVLARHPWSADAMNNVGMHFLRRGDAVRARVYLLLATEAAPHVSLYRANLGRAYAALGDQAEARAQAAAAADLRARYGRRTLSLHDADDPAVRAGWALRE